MKKIITTVPCNGCASAAIKKPEKHLLKLLQLENLRRSSGQWRADQPASMITGAR